MSRTRTTCLTFLVVPALFTVGCARLTAVVDGFAQAIAQSQQPPPGQTPPDQQAPPEAAFVQSPSDTTCRAKAIQVHNSNYYSLDVIAVVNQLESYRDLNVPGYGERLFAPVSPGQLQFVWNNDGTIGHPPAFLARAVWEMPCQATCILVNVMDRSASMTVCGY